MAAATPLRPPRIDDAMLDDLDESGVDGSPALEGDVDLYRVRLRGRHAGARGAGELAEVVVDGADLSETRFDRLDLSDVAFRRADLSNAVWEGVLARRVTVEGCRAVGLRLFVDRAEDLLVADCRWEHGSLYLDRAKGPVVFRSCAFAGTTLRGDLSGVVFDDCVLAGAEFGAGAADGSDLRTSRLDGARGVRTLAGARITTDQAVGLADLFARELGFTVE